MQPFKQFHHNNFEMTCRGILTRIISDTNDILLKIVDFMEVYVTVKIEVKDRLFHLRINYVIIYLLNKQKNKKVRE